MIQLSSLPVAIIIIGVGKADFTDMKELDGDDVILTDDMGNTCHRDCVNFMEYKDAMLRGNIGEQVLKEIPEQICGYMRAVNFELEVSKRAESIQVEEKEEEQENELLLGTG